LDKGSTNMTIRFAVIGVNHNHIFGQVNALLGASASFVGFLAPEDDLAADFAARYPQALRFDSRAGILDDPNIALVASAAVNAERAALGIEVMRAESRSARRSRSGPASHSLAQYRRRSLTRDTALARVGDKRGSCLAHRRRHLGGCAGHRYGYSIAFRSD
jgi:hypothetical protein